MCVCVCVRCEMGKHNGRLVALTMRFHRKQGGDRVIRWHVSKCDFSSTKTKVVHSPVLAISLSLCIRFQKASPSALSLMSFQTWRTVSLFLQF